MDHLECTGDELDAMIAFDSDGMNDEQPANNGLSDARTAALPFLQS